MARTKKKSLSKPGRGPGRPTKEETLRNGMKWKTGKAGKSGPNLGKWKIFVHRVLKQVHPDIRISSKSMSIMESFCNDLFERIAQEASKLAKYNKKPTVGSREIQTAVRLLIPGELGKHAVSEGTKAVTKYDASR